MNSFQMHIEARSGDKLEALSSTVRRLIDSHRLGDALAAIQSFVQEVIFDPSSTAVVFVSPQLDALCKAVASAKAASSAAYVSGDRAGTVFLVSELSRAGGHNELMKDIVRLALFPQPLCIVQTDCFERLDVEVSDAFAAETGVAVRRAGGKGADEKFSWLVEFLRDARPEKLLLLAHNQDALAVAAAFTDLASPAPAEVVYIHHGDHHLSLGAATPDFIHVDPHNIGYFHCRDDLGNRRNHYWPMTVGVPEDLLRKPPFIAAGQLVTCSSGRVEKFEAGSYAYDYFKLLPDILRTTGGTHVHIGDLQPARVGQIGQALAAAGIDQARFVHLPWVPSVARALIDQKIDLYISSFPLGGGKATLEAMAAGIPLLMHQSYRSRFFGGVDLAYPGALVWRDARELIDTLAQLDADLLLEHSVRARSHFKKFHSEDVLTASCDFNAPQDESTIPPLKDFRRDALKCFFDDERRRHAELMAGYASRDGELKRLGGEVRRLEAAIPVKDEQLTHLGDEVHRLEAVIPVKDEQLVQLGEELHRLQAVIPVKDDQLTYLGDEVHRLEAVIPVKDEQLIQLGKEVHRLEVVVDCKDQRLQIIGSQLELAHDLRATKKQALEEAEMQLAEMARQSAKLHASIAELSSLPVRIRDLEEALALSASVAESQRNYFYAEVDKRDKLLSEAKATYGQLQTELQTTVAALHTLQLTRWFRLRQVLLFHPFGVRKLVLLAATICGGMLPRRWHSRLVPSLRRLFGLAPVAPASVKTARASTAYQVKSQPRPSEDGPLVVHALANFMTGGSSRLVIDIVEHLGGHYRQSVFTSFNPDPPAYEGVPIEECRSPDSVAPFIAYFERMRPSLVHVHYWGDCDEPWYARVIEAARHLGLPVVENINTPIAPYRSDTVVRYVYVSDYVRSVFGDSAANHVTVYPGSDFELFTRAPNEHAPDDCVGMVYRLEHDKLNEDAIQPFIRIAELRRGTRILIVGGGSLLEPFQAAVKAAGVADCFEFTGYVPYEALPDLYRRMSLFVAPIWKESFGQVAPFAMSMKVPVVGYDVGAIGEIIGNRALLAPAADADALAAIAVSLLDAPEKRREIAAAQQRRAQERFSVQAMISNYAQIYSESTQNVRQERS